MTDARDALPPLILVVDDEETQRLLTRSHLEDDDIKRGIEADP